MKIKRAIVCLLAAVTFLLPCAACAKEDDSKKDTPFVGQTFADIALKKAAENLTNAKTAECTFSCVLDGKDETDENWTTLQNIDGEIIVTAEDTGLAYAANLSYGENDRDTLLYSDGNTGRYDVESMRYEEVSGITLAEENFLTAFESIVRAAFSDVLIEKDNFFDGFSAACSEHGKRVDDTLSVTNELSNIRFYESIFENFAFEGEIATGTIGTSIVLHKKQGVESLDCTGEFSIKPNGKSAEIFGREIEWKENVRGRFSIEFSSLSEKKEEIVPDKFFVNVTKDLEEFSLFQDDWKPILTVAKKNATIRTFETKLFKSGRKYYYEIALRASYKNATWTFVFRGEARTGEQTELVLEIIDYKRVEEKTTYLLDEDYPKKEDRITTARLDTEKKQIDISALKLKRNWYGTNG